MKGKQKYFVKVKDVEGKDIHFKDVEIDIFDIKNEEGKSLGSIMDELILDKQELNGKMKHLNDKIIKFIKAFKGGEKK